MNAVREEAAKVAVAVAEKILRKELAAKDRQQAYIEKLVDEVKDGIKGSDSK
jgi:F0F1-type ATP synthase membrane subunit b/b'